MPGPGTNGRRITREDLQAAYSNLMGEGEAEARAAAPQGLATAGAAAMAASPWPSSSGAAVAAAARLSLRSGGCRSPHGRSPTAHPARRRATRARRRLDLGAHRGCAPMSCAAP